MQTEQVTEFSEPLQKLRARLGARLTGLSPPPPQIIDRSKAVLLIWFYVFVCFGVSFCTVCFPSVCLDDIQLSLGS